MKNFKKALSIFMVLCMMLVSVRCIGAFATADSLAKLEEDVTAFDGKLSVAEPDADTLAAYEKLVEAFKALTADEKDEMDIIAFDKLYHLALDREKQISIKNNPDIKAYDKQHTINAHEQLTVAFGGLPSYIEPAVALAAVLNGKNASASDKLAAFTSASANARVYAGLYNAANKAFSSTISTYPTKAFETVVNAVSDDMLAVAPFGEAELTKPTKPNAKNYAGGTSDPEYIKDYNAYLEANAAYYNRDARAKNYAADLDLKAMEQVAAVAAEYAPIVEVVKALIAGKQAYDADPENTQPAAAAVKAYDALTELQQLQTEKLSFAFFYVAEDKGSYYSVTSKKVSALYTTCVDIGSAGLVDEFVAVIDSITEPYTREDIEAAKAAYNNIPKSLTGNIPSEIKAKYEAILAAIGPDAPSEEKPDLSNMPSTEVKYPIAESKVVPTAESLYNSIIALTDSDIDIKKTVFSGSFIGTVVSWLYPTLGNASSMVAYTPAELATKLTEPQYAKAVEKLKAAATYDENGKLVKDMEDWKKVSFENGDFGFEDGDKEAFLDALSATFRQISLISMIVDLENKISTSSGTYTYGAYEELIPVLEALDLNGIVSSHEYTLGVDAAKGDLKMDARVRPILVPIANLIEEFANDPVNTVLNVLPKLGYVIDSDLLNDQLAKLLSKVKLIKVGEIDLTSEGLYNIINKKLTAEDASIKLSLSKENFVAFIHDLAGCGTYTVRSSVARGTAYRAGLDSNKAAALIVTWNYLYGELVSADNVAAIKGLIDGLEVAGIVKSLAKGLVSVVAKVKSGTAFRFVAFVNILLKVVVIIKNVVAKVKGIIKK